MTTKKIAVIGAGACGLPAIKCCLDEGLQPVCLERTYSIGGLWNYTEEVRPGQACVMKSTIINTSKEIMAFSDLPIPKEFPNYMHNQYVMKYFHFYADHFELKKYIQFGKEVEHLVKADDFEKSGKWKLIIKDVTSGKASEQIFDGVMVCTGHHAEPNLPSLPGLDVFQGKVVHTHDFKDSYEFVDKHVLVIGLGNSGGDVAVELGHIASQVWLSTRRGTWVLNRVSEYGLPADIVAIRRIFELLPLSLKNTMTQSKLQQRFDHDRYGLRPKHGIFHQHPFVNDELPNRILSGGVIIKPDIKEFTKTGVIFEDGTREDNLDAVVMATGYIFGFPFIDESVLNVEHNEVNLYKYMFPPDLSHGTMAVIGCFQPWGAIMPMAELQCRWVTRLLKGICKLPAQSKMRQDIKDKQTAMRQRYVTSHRHTIQVDAIPYMDEIASQVGCLPQIGKLLCSDTKLALKVFFGPCTPYQYRLHGPGAWSGARQAILTQWDRIEYPLRTRKCPPNPKQWNAFRFFVIASVLFFLFLAILIKFL